MKFSLSTLVIAVFIVAVVTNSMHLLFRQSVVRANIAKTKAETAMADAQFASSANGQTREQFVETNEFFATARQKLVDQFESFVEARFKVQQTPGYFSIVNKPRFQSRSFLKSYLVFVPDNQKIFMHVEIENASAMTADSNGRFESNDDQWIEIPKGKHEITFEFSAVEVKNPDENLNRVVQLYVDDESVFSRKFGPQRSFGHSSSNFSFSKNPYSTNQKLPRIIRFQPSDGIERIVVSIAREAGE